MCACVCVVVVVEVVVVVVVEVVAAVVVVDVAVGGDVVKCFTEQNSCLLFCAWKLKLEEK